MSQEEKDKLDLTIKKYKLDNLLLLIADKSREMYLGGKSFETIDWYRKIGGFDQKLSQLMPIWGLAELSFRAICNSNDHRSREANFQDLCALNNLLAEVTDKKAGGNISYTSSGGAGTAMLLGLSQTQFWWQEIAKNRNSVVYSFLRYYLLLYKIPNYFSQFKHPDKDLFEITGFNIPDFSKLLFVLYAWTATTPTSEISLLKDIAPEITEKNPIVTLENIARGMQFFVGDYDYYRSGHVYNPLFFRPIVKTQTGRLIVSNTFIIVRKFYEGIYWLIRDKYRAIDSRDFTSAFGYYYERYINEILEFYLKPGTFRKIDQEGKADWIIESDKYTLIIEQKSSMMSIELKKQYPSIEKMDEYLQNFLKARKQLQNTVVDAKDKNKEIIKLILHFEIMHFKESLIKKELIRLEGSKQEDFRNCYLIDTEEFEQLIQLLSDDLEGFYEVIKIKRDYDIAPPPPVEGLDFSDVIKKNKKWVRIRFLEASRNIFDGLMTI